MNIKFLFLGFATVTFIVGCSAGATGTVKPQDDGYQSVIEYNSAQIGSRLTIKDVKVRKVNDLLQASVDLRNTWNFKLDFQYKFKFFDKDGFEVDPDGRPWTPLLLTGDEVGTVQATAPNATAESFRIIVQD